MKDRIGEYFTEIANYFIIVLTYLLCDGLTTILVKPAQASFAPDLTQYAQFLFLPHGLRVLTVWFCGWKGVIPLVVGSLLSALIFSPNLLSPFVFSILFGLAAFGALSAILAFEALRLAGIDLYFGKNTILNWRLLLLVGGFAALLDAVFRVLVYGDLIPQDITRAVLVTVILGDVLGQVFMMLGLMMLFRLLRNA